MAGHAYLSASSSHRWMVCTAAPALESQFPDSTSEYAAEGTRAHTMAYECLRDGIDAKEWRDRKVISIEVMVTTDEEMQELFDQLDRDFPPEMVHYVQQFLDYVNECIAHARARDPGAHVMLESRLDFSRWVPEGFGTGDVVLVYDGVVEVIDLKYGKGVKVDPIDNSQLRLYGLGAYHELDAFFDIHTVSTTIHQPRLDHVDTETSTAADLLAWADSVLVPAARAAYTGEGAVFAPGEEQCRFCRARSQCEARAQYNLEVARQEFAEPGLLSDEQIAEILPRVNELRAWVEDIHEYALKRAEAGHRWPGYKLVEGRSNRYIPDTDAALRTLIDAGYAKTEVCKPPELLTIAQLEKTIGKKPVNELLAGLIDKPRGKPVLVPVSDKRPELPPRSTAAEDFADDADGADDE